MIDLVRAVLLGRHDAENSPPAGDRKKKNAVEMRGDATV
jgi:hypothetical protein